MVDQPERVVYAVTVTVPPVGGGGPMVKTYEGVGGMKLIAAGDQAIITLFDTELRNKAILALGPGYQMDFTVTETLKPIDLSVPGTLINHDFTKTH